MGRPAPQALHPILTATSMAFVVCLAGLVLGMAATVSTRSVKAAIFSSESGAESDNEAED